MQYDTKGQWPETFRERLYHSIRAWIAVNRYAQRFFGSALPVLPPLFILLVGPDSLEPPRPAQSTSFDA